MFEAHSEIMNAWIRQLRLDWRNANYGYFGGSMSPPCIDLIHSEKIMGKWEGGMKRKLSISSLFISRYPWQYVQEILYHEMAHQYVEEILKITEESSHGQTFKRICCEKGFDYRASGDMSGWIDQNRHVTAESCSHKALQKIQKLLALAQSTSPHEAELAMSKAQELLLRYNISLLELEAQRKYIHLQIGQVGKKNPVKSMVGLIISKFYFVEAIWVFGYDQFKNRSGRILEIYGTPENVALAEYVHDYLHTVSEIFWNDYKKRERISGNKHRRTYIYGLLHGFHEKLEARAAENRARSLIWRGDPLLMDYYHRRNPKVRRSHYHYSRSCQEIYRSGMTSGRKLVIHKGITHGHSGEVHLLR